MAEVKQIKKVKEQNKDFLKARAWEIRHRMDLLDKEKNKLIQEYAKLVIEIGKKE